MRSGKFLLGLVAAGSIGSLGGAQTVRKLVQENDTIIGMGALKTISYLQILDTGTWIASIDTDFVDTTRDGAILRNGFVTLREGTTLFSPAGSTLDDFVSINMPSTGHLALCLKVAPGARDGLYWNTVKIVLKDEPLVSPLVGAGTTWRTFNLCKMNSANEVFVIGDANNPANGTGPDATLCKYTVDGVGNVLSTEVLLTKSQFIPALGTSVNDLPNTEHSLAVNSRGDYLTLIQGLGNANAYVLNGVTIVAQEGFPAPVPGRVWNVLTNGPKLSLNDRGDYVFTGSMQGTSNNYIVVKNGEKFAQQGDILPDFSPDPLANGTPAPLYVANNGDVYWRADSASGDAFMRNYKPIVKSNSTVFQGDLVTNVELTDNSFAISPNGRFWAGRVDLQVGGEAALFVDFGLVLEIPGCLGNEPELKVTDGLALPGDALTFSMDLGNAVGALPVILFSTRQRFPGSDCGANTPYGELLISTAHQVGRIILPTWNGNDPSTKVAPIPPNLALVNQTFFAQGFFRDLSGASSPAFALTNALRIEIGAP